MFKKPMSDGRSSDSPFAMPTDDLRPRNGSPSTSKIGPSVRITGELVGSEPLIFEGEIEGQITLTGQTLVIGAEGSVKGEIHAGVVRVEGEVQGNITATEQIIVSSSGRVFGDMIAPRLSLEDGAKLKGSIDTHCEAELPSEPLRNGAAERPGKMLPSFIDDDLPAPHVIHS